jgi:periplasmic protein TonB
MGTRPRRLGGALGVSIAVHLGFAVLAVIFMSLSPTRATGSDPPIPLDVVYLPEPAASGGGGGGPVAARPQPPAVAPHTPPRAVTEPAAEPTPEPPQPTLDAAVASNADVMRFAGQFGSSLSGLGGAPGIGAGPGAGPGLGPGGPEGAGGGPPGRGGSVTPPVATLQVQPTYTTAAMVAKIQGAVRLLVVVRADGTVGDVKVVGSLDSRYGLDDRAVAAARAWRFTPGLRQGVPVDVQVVMILEFHLH